MADVNTRIRCAGCEKLLLPLRFSETSRRKHFESKSAHQRNPQVTIKRIRCNECNPQSRYEMKCVICDQTMGLDKFAKAQRRKTDDAHCLHCQQEKDDREPDYEKEVEEVKIMDDYKRNQPSASATHHSSIASATYQSGTRQSQSDQYETDTNPGSTSWALGNDAVSLAGTEASRPASTRTRVITGTGWDSFAGDERYTSSRSKNPGFAKQNAVGKDLQQKVQEQLAREQARAQQEEEQVERDESDSDSEASDNPY